jgi:hypothetical protein
MPKSKLSKWSELFPHGRFIFYEGKRPKAFVAEIKRKFGFDPSKDDGWGEVIENGEDSFTSYGFHCPAEHLDAIYSTDYPMGS